MLIQETDRHEESFVLELNEVLQWQVPSPPCRLHQVLYRSCCNKCHCGFQSPVLQWVLLYRNVQKKISKVYPERLQEVLQ